MQYVSIHTQAVEDWLSMKGSCPGCGAKSIAIKLVSDYVVLARWLECSKCGHSWDSQPLTPNEVRL